MTLFLFTLPSFSINGRTKEKFDDGWQFHLGDLRINRAVKAGKYGGITDWRQADGDAMKIAYNDKDKAAPYNPSEWKDVSLPHDCCVEGCFVNDTSVVIDGTPEGLVSHGFLPVGTGLYRKQFDIPDSDKGKGLTL